jgi:NTP pyrophosphatase (non-canonical NTP hydrolase)
MSTTTLQIQRAAAVAQALRDGESAEQRIAALQQERDDFRADWEVAERRAIEFGDIIARYTLAMQAFMIDAMREAGAPGEMADIPASAYWINNTLVGPGHMVPDEALQADGQTWFDAKIAEHEAFRAAHPAPGQPVVGELRRQVRALQAQLGSTKYAGNILRDRCHGASTAAGWWADLKTGEPIIQRPHVVGEKLALIHSEISEAMEGHRKGLMDDKLPHRKMVEVELADAVIRIADLAGALGLDLGGAIEEKMAFNAVRPDHKPEARMAEGGKAY